MNEIIMSLIDWCQQHDCMVSFDMFSGMGDNFIKLKLSRKDESYSRIFEVGGGVLCKENWLRYKNALELEDFIRAALATLSDDFKKARDDLIKEFATNPPNLPIRNFNFSHGNTEQQDK